MDGRHILVGVTGGIAAYKTVQLVSRLRQRGATVTVIMTANARKFVTPLTFQTVSAQQVITDYFDAPETYIAGHVALAGKADLLVIAPATANIIGKIAAGLADDALTTTVLSLTCPILVCPAMNEKMFQNAATQDNLRRLEERGLQIIGPEKGWQACGTVGLGRMTEPDEILRVIEKKLSP